MRVQLWSYNYDPEPSGIGPVSTTLARALRGLGHDVDVVAAHPHYPEPVWETGRRPYRETRDGIEVLRLPLWVGRDTAAQRIRQELSFTAVQSAALPFLRRADIGIVASPSFPALLPAIIHHRVRRVPWVLWLHDILPDGATATGLVEEGTVLSLARRLETLAYGEADRVVVLSRPFCDNLAAKGVPADKVTLVYDPATRVPGPSTGASDRFTLLSMGNIGFSQGLAPLVAAFDAAPDLDVRFVITGAGVAADDVRAEARTDRVEMVGMLDDDDLERELQGASIAFVSQHYEGSEFNIPSKIMNFMAYGLPILAAVNPDGEVARIVREAGAGWVVDSSLPETFPAKLRELRSAPAEVAEKAAAARAFGERHFSIDGFAARFDEVLREVAGRA